MAITMNNSANITYQHGTSTDAANSNLVTTMLAENHSLKAEKTSLNTSWRPSENLTFSVRIENDGAEPIYAISMQDNLGGNPDRLLNYIVGSARMLKNDVLTGIAPTSTSPLTFVLPDTLAAGEVAILTYVAKVIGNIDESIEEITNEVTVVGHEESAAGPTITVDPLPSVTISRADYANVTIKKFADKENVIVGDTLTYTFQLENSGNIDATKIVIRDSLPTNFTITSISSLTDGVTTTFETTDYSVDTDNNLILPTSVTKTISVPAATTAGVGVTIVTIVGSITD